MKEFRQHFHPVFVVFRFQFPISKNFPSTTTCAIDDARNVTEILLTFPDGRAAVILFRAMCLQKSLAKKICRIKTQSKSRWRMRRNNPVGTSPRERITGFCLSPMVVMRLRFFFFPVPLLLGQLNCSTLCALVREIQVCCYQLIVQLLLEYPECTCVPKCGGTLSKVLAVLPTAANRAPARPQGAVALTCFGVLAYPEPAAFTWRNTCEESAE